MIVKPKETTIAYRCPHCGGAIKSIVGVFALNAEMLKIKCPCKKSEMTIKYSSDKKIRITVPCFVCRTDHTYTVNESVIFSGEMFYLNCRYSGVDICFTGKENDVAEEIDKTLDELSEMLDTSPEELFGETEEYDEVPDISEIAGIVLTIKELAADGKIRCACEEKGESLYNPEDMLTITGLYENNCICTPQLTFDGESLVLECSTCGAKYVFPKGITAAAFAETNELILE